MMNLESGEKHHEPEPSEKDSPMLLIEAALFSSGRPMAEEEISQVTGVDPSMVGLYLKKLAMVYSRRETSLEVIKAGRKHLMRIRETYVEKVGTLASPEIPQRLIKTAALIAYHQPMKQSELVDMYGQKVYDHVKELTRLGLVISRKEGATRVLTTTQRFAEVFGIDSVSKKKVKGFVRNRALEKAERISRITLDRYEPGSGEEGAPSHVEGDDKKEEG